DVDRPHLVARAALALRRRAHALRRGADALLRSGGNRKGDGSGEERRQRPPQRPHWGDVGAGSWVTVTGRDATPRPPLSSTATSETPLVMFRHRAPVSVKT